MISVAKACSEYGGPTVSFLLAALGPNYIRLHTSADTGTEIGHFVCCVFTYSFTVPLSGILIFVCPGWSV